MSTENGKETQAKIIDFNQVDAWLSRLYQIIQSTQEWGDFTMEALSLITSAGPGDDMAVMEAIMTMEPIDHIEMIQIESLRAMLGHIGDFSRFIASRYFVGLLPPHRKLDEGVGAETHLLRAMLEHLSTDLSIVQLAFSQRQRKTSANLPEPQLLLNDFLEELTKKQELFFADEASAQATAAMRLSGMFRKQVAKLSMRTKQAEMLISADLLGNEALAPAQKYIQSMN